MLRSWRRAPSDSGHRAERRRAITAALCVVALLVAGCSEGSNATGRVWTDSFDLRVRIISFIGSQFVHVDNLEMRDQDRENVD